MIHFCYKYKKTDVQRLKKGRQNTNNSGEALDQILELFDDSQEIPIIDNKRLNYILKEIAKIIVASLAENKELETSKNIRYFPTERLLCESLRMYHCCMVTSWTSILDKTHFRDIER